MWSSYHIIWLIVCLSLLSRIRLHTLFYTHVQLYLLFPLFSLRARVLFINLIPRKDKLAPMLSNICSLVTLTVRRDTFSTHQTCVVTLGQLMWPLKVKGCDLWRSTLYHIFFLRLFWHLSSFIQTIFRDSICTSSAPTSVLPISTLEILLVSLLRQHHHFRVLFCLLFHSLLQLHQIEVFPLLCIEITCPNREMSSHSVSTV